MSFEQNTWIARVPIKYQLNSRELLSYASSTAIDVVT